MTNNKPNAAAFAQNLLRDCGERDFMQLDATSPEARATITRRGMDPDEVQREITALRQSIRAYNELH